MAEKESSARVGLLEPAEFLFSSQKRVYRVLRELFERQRIPQSMLFTGPDGSGKSAAAIVLASWLNCDCGESRMCESCVKISSLEHPDVHLIFPVPYGDWEKALSEVIQEKRENFFASQRSSSGGSIGIDAIRNIIEWTSKKPYEGKFSVVILFDAHAMTVEAQNAFLKVLEEPSSSTVFILITEFPDRLLPTIISRCQNVRFGYLPEETVSEFLKRYYSADDETAIKYGVLSMGDVERAIMLFDGSASWALKEASAVIKGIVSGRKAKLLESAERVASAYSREEVKDLLGEITIFLRIAMRGIDRGYTDVEFDVLKELLGGKSTLNALHSRELPQWIEKVSSSAKSLARNADVELTLAQLFLDLAGLWY